MDEDEDAGGGMGEDAVTPEEGSEDPGGEIKEGERDVPRSGQYE